MSQRLRKQDFENNKRLTEIIKLKEALQQSDMEKIHLTKKIERITEMDIKKKNLSVNQ